VGRRGGKRAALAARLATAALRVSDPRLGALPVVASGPQILVHEGARQAIERRLGAAFEGAVRLAVTDNRRRMITHLRLRGTLRVRIHLMFLGAPEQVVDSLVRFVVDGDREASKLLGRYIDANAHRIRAAREVAGPLRSRGRYHDLEIVLARVNQRYFGGNIGEVRITWGRRSEPRELRRVSIKLGSYSAAQRLIRVHPALDRNWVPRYFVEYIIYHELLHHVIPAVQSCRRALFHSPEFLHHEREFRHYERSIAWERKHIDRLLRAR
jgi:predicted metal-dependent hydrolase